MSDQVKPALSPTSFVIFSASREPPASSAMSWRVMSLRRTQEILERVDTSARIHSGTSMFPAKRYFMVREAG